MAKFVIAYKNPDYQETTFSLTVESDRAQIPEQAKEIFEEQYKGFKVTNVSQVDLVKLR